MTNHDYPHTGYGVEVHTSRAGWVLLEGIHRTRAAATEIKQSLIDKRVVPDPDDLRVVTLTIARKENE